MAYTLTVTGKEMGAITVTTKLYSGILGLKLNPVKQLVTVTKSDGNDEDIDISGATTLTGTISATALTLVIS